MRGPYKNREYEYTRAIELRRSGYGYRSIVPVDKRVAHKNWVANWVVHEKQETLPTGKNAVRQRLIEERGNVCELCGLDHWLGGPIVLEMHRKNAGKDYNRENVVLLCPNCHSTTDTWRNRKRGGVAEWQTQRT